MLLCFSVVLLLLPCLSASLERLFMCICIIIYKHLMKDEGCRMVVAKQTIYVNGRQQ